jgi:hypothetical protein
MINQLNEIDSSEKIDAIEQHLLAQINKMKIPCKTNEMLEQLKENQMLMLTTLMNEMRFTRHLVKEVGDVLNEHS